jgi:16S rRNA (guanine966-N2)-methyltransferase
VLVAGAAGGWFADDALLVVERSTRAGPWAFPAGVRPEGSRRYGETMLWYGRRYRDRPADIPAARPADDPADP